MAAHKNPESLLTVIRFLTCVLPLVSQPGEDYSLFTHPPQLSSHPLTLQRTEYFFLLRFATQMDPETTAKEETSQEKWHWCRANVITGGITVIQLLRLTVTKSIFCNYCTYCDKTFTLKLLTPDLNNHIFSHIHLAHTFQKTELDSYWRTQYSGFIITKAMELAKVKAKHIGDAAAHYTGQHW